MFVYFFHSWLKHLFRFFLFISKKSLETKTDVLQSKKTRLHASNLSSDLKLQFISCCKKKQHKIYEKNPQLCQRKYTSVQRLEICRGICLRKEKKRAIKTFQMSTESRFLDSSVFKSRHVFPSFPLFFLAHKTNLIRVCVLFVFCSLATIDTACVCFFRACLFSF